MPPLHPAIVHFPIALLVVSVLLDACGVLLRREGLTQAGFLTLALGSIGAGLAALTGPAEEARDTAAQSALLLHELLALGTVVVCLALVGLRIGNAAGLHGTAVYGYLALGLVLVVAVVATGYVGGQLTYTHGVGVSRVQGGAGPPERGGAVGEMWAKIAGLGLLLVVVGYGVSLARASGRAGRAGRDVPPPAPSPRWTLSAEPRAPNETSREAGASWLG